MNITDSRQEYFLQMVSQSIESLNLKYVQISHKVDSKMSVDDLMQFALTNLMHSYHAVRIACAVIINSMAKYFIDKDVDQYGSRQEQNKNLQAIDMSCSTDWHLLHKFTNILEIQNEWIKPYIEEFE